MMKKKTKKKIRLYNPDGSYSYVETKDPQRQLSRYQEKKREAQGYPTGMPNKAYWKQRNKETLKDAMRKGKDVEEYINYLYKQDKNKLIKEYKKLYHAYEGKPKDARYYHEIERLKRLIENRCNKTATRTDKAILKELRQAYKVTGGGFKYTKRLPASNKKVTQTVLKSFNLPNLETIDRIIKSPWTKDGREFSDRVWAHKEKLRENLQKTLLNAVETGESLQKTSKKFRDIYGQTVYQNTRLVRTETLRVYNQGALDRYTEAGTIEFEILREPDCCDMCAKKDLYVPIELAEIGDTLPTWHPNCRCTFVPSKFKEI